MDDRKYWNKYYESHKPGSDGESPFAQAVNERYLNGSGSILDLGCGNGRDSLYFAAKGLSVTGIDSAEVAIQSLQGKAGCRFVCGDFVTLDGMEDSSFDYCYSRFTVHAISQDQEAELLGNVLRVLREGGRFFIEVRSVNDGIYGLGEAKEKDAYIYEGHYRRFIRLRDFVNRLCDAGFSIEYAEESDRFAPYKDSRPVCIRLTAVKGSLRNSGTSGTNGSCGTSGTK